MASVIFPSFAPAQPLANAGILYLGLVLSRIRCNRNRKKRSLSLQAILAYPGAGGIAEAAFANGSMG